MCFHVDMPLCTVRREIQVINADSIVCRKRRSENVFFGCHLGSRCMSGCFPISRVLERWTYRNRTARSHPYIEAPDEIYRRLTDTLCRRSETNEVKIPDCLCV